MSKPYSELLPDIIHWGTPIKGLYRFIFATNCCYEIHILHHDSGQKIEEARAALYIAGELFESTKEDGAAKNYYEREMLVNGTVKECLEEAVKDYRENVQE